MANTDFGLSFTVSTPALWTDNERGKIGAPSTIFSNVVSLFKIGAPGTIFANVVLLEKQGASSQIEAFGLCFRRSFTDGGPLDNTLSGPGRSSTACG